jgi:hypothetical protein
MLGQSGPINKGDIGRILLSLRASVWSYCAATCRVGDRERGGAEVCQRDNGWYDLAQLVRKSYLPLKSSDERRMKE